MTRIFPETKIALTYKLIGSDAVPLCNCFDHVPSIIIRKSQPSLHAGKVLKAQKIQLDFNEIQAHE